MVVIQLDRLFNVLSNSAWKDVIKKYEPIAETSKRNFEEEQIPLHGAISVLIAILYST